MTEELTTQEEVESLMSPEGGAAIIDFWSPTCGPCMAMGPAFDAVATEHGDDPVRFIKINTASQSDLASAFHIRSVPTLLFVNNGEILDVRVGALNGPALKKKAKWLINKASGKGFISSLLGR